VDLFEVGHHESIVLCDLDTANEAGTGPLEDIFHTAFRIFSVAFFQDLNLNTVAMQRRVEIVCFYINIFLAFNTRNDVGKARMNMIDSAFNDGGLCLLISGATLEVTVAFASWFPLFLFSLFF
jgi:hypothetical protein